MLLETKLGTIEHDINKFMGNYNVVQTFCESGYSEDTLRKNIRTLKKQAPMSTKLQHYF
jgi:hypothetical protein